MASDFIYTAQPANIVPFLEKIRGAGVPEKITLKTIESFGFKTKNDRRLLPILKGLGLVNTSGVPTARWNQFRSKQTGGVALAQGVREHYASLFALYPDAHQKDSEALHSFFSSHTKVGEATLKLIVATFKAVCSRADFEKDAITDVDPVATSDLGSGVAASVPIRVIPARSSGLMVNLNIELTLPENSDAKTFDEFFKSMRKHLLEDND